MDIYNYRFDKRIGIGLRTPHIAELLNHTPKLGWLEVHSENWLAEHGPVAEQLEEIGAHYPLSLHGVGLSLGSADGVDRKHLLKLAGLVSRCNPVLVSEHLSWGRIGELHSNDLLPLPFNQAAIDVLVHNIDAVQQTLGRRILVENLSSYCTFESSSMPEWEFVCRVVEKADCELLLDLNNLYVNSHNHGFASRDYLNALPTDRISEIHLAGFDNDGSALLDTHGKPVQAPVWELYESYLPRLPGTARTLIEWDTDLPEFGDLLAQAYLADNRIKESHHAAA